MDLCADDADKRADIEGPFACAGPPAYTTLVIEETGRDFDIFLYEASHPLATADLAFPCAGLRDDDNIVLDYQAPLGEAAACSKAGVRPWHSVKWADADAACAAVPVAEGSKAWRLCEHEEWLRACQGPDRNAFATGPSVNGLCNIREAFTAAGADFPSEAPTGEYEDCVTPEGAFDLTGNVAEWTNKRNEQSSRDRYNIGGGWRTSAEFHDELNWQCQESERRQVGQFAPTYKTEALGFRCCRRHVD